MTSGHSGGAVVDALLIRQCRSRASLPAIATAAGAGSATFPAPPTASAAVSPATAVAPVDVARTRKRGCLPQPYASERSSRAKRRALSDDDRDAASGTAARRRDADAVAPAVIEAAVAAAPLHDSRDAAGRTSTWPGAALASELRGHHGTGAAAPAVNEPAAAAAAAITEGAVVTRTQHYWLKTLATTTVCHQRTATLSFTLHRRHGAAGRRRRDSRSGATDGCSGALDDPPPAPGDT